MGIRVDEILVQLDQDLDRALSSPDSLETLEFNFPDYVFKVRTNLSELRAYTNSHFACKIVQRVHEEENHLFRIRRDREKCEEESNKFYFELKVRERLRRERGLSPRAVILPWILADDHCILIMQKPAPSARPPQTEQPCTRDDRVQDD
jgi:hypothetical protein